MNRMSRIFCPHVVTPKNAIVKSTELTSKSQKLLNDLGLIRSSNNGTFHILPLAQRSLDKCTDLVKQHMNEIGGQKVSLPILTATSLWKKSGRLDTGISEFFITKDRHGKDHLLSPTHEESVTSLISMSGPISYKQLPLLLYQIGPKFRDELKARFGLMRAKEFIMKDMYTFDKDMKSAEETYDRINSAYLSLFQKLQVPFVKVLATTGMMGGSVSHEYHFISNIGEDNILKCKNCGYAFNEEVVGTIDAESRCGKCEGELDSWKGMEIGHTFLLKDKYSKPLGATFLNSKGKPENLYMGCYGIGVSRLMAASLEVLSTETDLKWPTLLSPYDICIIPPKEGSKEEHSARNVQTDLINQLNSIYTPDEILIDDRTNLTIGKRLMDAKRMGYPIILVIGSKSSETIPSIEFYFNNDRIDLDLSNVCKEVLKFDSLKKSLLKENGSSSSVNNIAYAQN